MLVEDTGGTARLKALFAKLREELPSKVLAVGIEMAAEAAALAPTPEEEYEVMMVGDGNLSGITNIPAMPQSDGDSDGDHRLRFYKPMNDYLQPTIIKSVVASGLNVGVGSIAALNAASKYTWRNVDGEEWTCRTLFWEAWETGVNNAFVIEPKHYPEGAKGPTLKPGIGNENKRYVMAKRIPRRAMFAGVQVNTLIDTSLFPAIRKIVREA